MPVTAARTCTLLVETRFGELLAVLFNDSDQARAWEDEHDTDLLVRGCARLATKAEALTSS